MGRQDEEPLYVQPQLVLGLCTWWLDGSSSPLLQPHLGISNGENVWIMKEMKSQDK